MMCKVLDVSTSGYYAWRKRPPSARTRTDQRLIEQIRQIHAVSRGTYGAPRVHVQLRANGVFTGCKRVARLMRAEGLRGAHRRKRRGTTRRGSQRRPAPDLVDRNFEGEAPNELWVADITFVSAGSRFLYLAVVVDAFSRRVVGWAMADHLRTELLVSALEMAVQQRHPDGTVHHSDQGCQYMSVEFGRRCREAGLRPSMGSVGDCYDNALCESFFATLECELIDREPMTNRTEARRAVFAFIEGW